MGKDTPGRSERYNRHPHVRQRLHRHSRIRTKYRLGYKPSSPSFRHHPRFLNYRFHLRLQPAFDPFLVHLVVSFRPAYYPEVGHRGIVELFESSRSIGSNLRFCRFRKWCGFRRVRGWSFLLGRRLVRSLDSSRAPARWSALAVSFLQSVRYSDIISVAVNCSTSLMSVEDSLKCFFFRLAG